MWLISGVFPHGLTELSTPIVVSVFTSIVLVATIFIPQCTNNSHEVGVILWAGGSVQP